MKGKEESEKAVLKFNIQKTKIMASAPITSWQIDGERVETVRDFIFLGSKITAYGDYSREIQRCLLLGRKVMTNLDSVLKSRDVILSTKVHLVKLMVLTVVTYGCESWTFTYGCESWALKNWYFWTVVLEKTLESPLNFKEIKPVYPKGDQSWIFIGRTDAEVESPVLWPLDGKNWLIGKDPDAGKTEGRRRRGRQRMRWMDMSLSKLQELVMDREAWRATVHGAAKTWTWLSNWTELIYLYLWGFPGGTSGKESPASAGDIRDMGSILGLEDPLKEEMATHSSILAWRIPWTEEPSRLQSWGHKDSHMTEVTADTRFYVYIDVISLRLLWSAYWVNYDSVPSLLFTSRLSNTKPSKTARKVTPPRYLFSQWYLWQL